MVRSELIVALETRGFTREQAESTVEAILESMTEALCRGERIEIRGFGSFCVKHYEGYRGTNPSTGQSIAVKPKNAIRFRAGKELLERLNRSPPLAISGLGQEPDEGSGVEPR